MVPMHRVAPPGGLPEHGIAGDALAAHTSPGSTAVSVNRDAATAPAHTRTAADVFTPYARVEGLIRHPVYPVLPRARSAPRRRPTLCVHALPGRALGKY